MKTCIAIFIMGGLHDSKSFWGALVQSVKGQEVDLIIVDNAPDAEDDPQQPKKFFDRFVTPFWPGEVFYCPQEDNLGMIKSMQFCYEQYDYDLYCFLHNDLYIYEHDWLQRVKQLVKLESKVGLVGFFGASGISDNGGRYYVWNNMLEAEIHGTRIDEGYVEVAVLDGLAMFATKEMLDVRGGFDLSFDIHHFYDKDLSLESIDRGFRNFIIPVYCHHQSGVTACKPIFQEWANQYLGVEAKGEETLYVKNELLWMKKWKGKLPWEVGREWPK